jgi:2-dehydropantoate 2-reductase
MKILIMGTGGVGGYYGGLLAQQGNEVTFISRGSHLYAMRHEGLKVKSVHGDFHVRPVSATEDPAKAEPVDLVLFCVKTYNTDEAAEAIRPVVGPQTVVLSLQNGVDAAERIGKVAGIEHVVGGATWLSAAVEEPGVIKQVSEFRRIVLGELGGGRSERIQSIFEVLNPTGITVEIAHGRLPFHPRDPGPALRHHAGSGVAGTCTGHRPRPGCGRQIAGVRRQLWAPHQTVDAAGCGIRAPDGA